MQNRDELYNSPEDAITAALDGRQVAMWTACPGIVTAVNLTKMTCEVQPALLASQTDDDGVVESVKMPVLLDVPIQFAGGGDFVLTFPLAIGDEVLVVFSSRCIDAWWQSGGYKNQLIEARMHDLSDGFAIPKIFSQPSVISSISTTSAQLRNRAGTSYVEMKADGKVKVASSVEIDLVGNVKITGNLDVSGTVVGASATTPISLTTHTHPVSTAPGTTGAPNP